MSLQAYHNHSAAPWEPGTEYMIDVFLDTSSNDRYTRCDCGAFRANTWTSSETRICQSDKRSDPVIHQAMLSDYFAWKALLFAGL